MSFNFATNVLYKREYIYIAQKIISIYTIFNYIIFDPVSRQLFRSQNGKYKIILMCLDS